jgi:hypothetical protein
MTNLPVKHEQDVFSVMDRLDDEIIQAELENRVVSTWVYSFESDGKPQTGLSKKGVDEACTEMAKKGHVIEEESLEYKPCPISSEHVLFTAKVRRVLINKDGSRVPMETVFGTKRQWIKDYRKSGQAVDDKFWYEKGSAKALRNARSRLIPAEIQAAIIGLAKQQGRVKDLRQETPKPAPKEEKSDSFITEAQRKRLFAIYRTAGKTDDEMKEYLFEVHGIESSKEIPKSEYESICKWAESKDRESGEE